MIAGTTSGKASCRLSGAQRSRSRRAGGRCYAGQWLENSAEQDVHLPVERCFDMWEDRERIPQWMPWIQSVKVCLSFLGNGEVQPGLWSTQQS